MNLKKILFLHQPMNRSAIKSGAELVCTSNIGSIRRYFGSKWRAICQYLPSSGGELRQTRSNGNRIKLLPLPPTRGLIYDRYGELLAENLTFSVYISCRKKLKI